MDLVAAKSRRGRCNPKISLAVDKIHGNKGHNFVRYPCYLLEIIRATQFHDFIVQVRILILKSSASFFTTETRVDTFCLSIETVHNANSLNTTSHSFEFDTNVHPRRFRDSDFGIYAPTSQKQRC